MKTIDTALIKTKINEIQIRAAHVTEILADDRISFANGCKTIAIECGALLADCEVVLREIEPQIEPPK